MEQEEIIAGNKLIALFMGAKVEKADWEYYWGTSFSPFRISKEHTCGSSSEEQVWRMIFDGQQYYHKDWNWIMPVVNKIEQLNLDIPRGQWVNNVQPDTYRVDMINRGMVEVLLNGERSIAFFEGPRTEVLTVWKAIVAFIEYYNNKK